MKEKNPIQTLKLQTVFNSFCSLLISSANKVCPNQIFLDLFNTVAVRFLILIINFSATTIITRALSIEDRGKYAILLSLINILVTIFTFGFHTSIVYRLSSNLKLFFASKIFMCASRDAVYK